MSEITVKEYAVQTGKSEQTIKRWLKSGRLSGHQRETPQGFMWYVSLDGTTRMPGDMPNGTASNVSSDMPGSYANGHDQGNAISESEPLREMIELLKLEVGNRDLQLGEKDKQISELHILLKNVQDRMLPAPKDSRPWWMKLFNVPTQEHPS